MSYNVNSKYNNLLISITDYTNESEVNARFQEFAKELIGYCSSEKRIFSTFRILHEIKADLTIKNKIIDLSICDIFDRICAFINTEIKIAHFKLDNPVLIEIDTSNNHKTPTLLHWTSDKSDLVELIYAISKSINNGTASIKKIADCFEFIFQISLGNYYDVFSDFNIRKNTTKYLDTLPGNLMREINRLNK